MLWLLFGGLILILCAWLGFLGFGCFSVGVCGYCCFRPAGFGLGTDCVLIAGFGCALGGLGCGCL